MSTRKADTGTHNTTHYFRLGPDSETKTQVTLNTYRVGNKGQLGGIKGKMQQHKN